MEEAGSVGVKSTKLACRRRFLASALLAPGAGPGHAGPEGWDALAAFTATQPSSLEHPYLAPAQPLGA